MTMSCKIVTRVVLPAAAICTVKEYKCKPSELPIYKPDLDSKTWKGNCLEGSSAQSGHPPPTLVEEAVGSIRKQLGAVCTEVGAYKENVASAVGSCVGQVTWVRNYLADENNVAPKPGAIGIGALTGFVFGLRGGLVKRVVYTSAGALAMAALCYPKQATEYSKLGLAETKKYVVIAYNFVYGGKSDDDVDMALLLLDPNLDSRLQKSQTVVEQLHDNAQDKDCHCPIGACLSSHDDDEGGTKQTATSQDGEEVIVLGEDCCVCICDEE